MIVGRDASSMVGIEGRDQAIEEFAALGGTVGKQPVHGRCQPQDAHMARHGCSALGGLTLDVNGAPFSGTCSEPGTHLDRAIGRCQGHRHGPGNARRYDRDHTRRTLAADLGEAHPAQTAAGGQERQRFEKVGFAGTVGTGEHDRAPIDLEA